MSTLEEEMEELNEIGEPDELVEPDEFHCTSAKCRTEEEDRKISENIGWTFIIFSIIWTFMIAINRFYGTAAWPILLIPYAMMGIGFLNKDKISDDKVEEGVFSATFISMGLVISLPLLTLFTNKILGSQDEKSNDPRKTAICSQLNHIIFLAMIMILLSYVHIWVDESMRHVCKIIRSCFETIAVTLYIFALTIFFMLT